MSPLLLWFNENWFSFLQSLGIIGSLYLTAEALRRDTRARKTSDLLTLLEQHRELWSEIHRRPDLARVLSAEVDLVSQPLSLAEEEFINLVMVHFETGWTLARSGSTDTEETLRADMRSFISLPLPRAVWEKTKRNRDRRFAGFVEGCLRAGRSGSHSRAKDG